jgi:hypothetical protein
MTGRTTSKRSARRPAKEESIEMLLALSGSEVILERMYLGLEQTIRVSVNQMLSEQPLSPQQQRAMGRVPAKVIAALRAECNWTLLRGQLVELYKRTFDQQEVEGLIHFYRSVAGRAILNATPKVVQGSIALAQARASFLLPKMERAMEQAVREAKLARKLAVGPQRTSSCIAVRSRAQR